jgi:SAM-dependent methyltransferase
MTEKDASMSDPLSIINLRRDEITNSLSSGSKHFIKTRYANEEAYTGGYTKYFSNLSRGKYRRNPDDKDWHWEGPRTLKFILKHISVADMILSGKEPVKVLDIGCSSGFMRKILESNTFKKGGVHYYGLEAGEQMLLAAVFGQDDIESGAAGDNIPSVYVNHDVRQGLPFIDGAFDFVLSFEMTKYLEKAEVKRLFKEISRVLKPGGRFIYSVYGICDDEKMLERVMRNKDEKFKSFWLLHEIEKALRGCDLSVTKVYGSESNYEPVRKILREEDRKTFLRMDSLYPREVMESFFGFFYPESTSSKLLVITKGIADLKAEVESMFPGETVEEMIHAGNCRIFAVGDKIVKYVDKGLFGMHNAVHKMLSEQTGIKLPRVLDVRESQVSENYVIVMERVGHALVPLWKDLPEDRKDAVVADIADMLKEIHGIRINPRQTSCRLRLFPEAPTWRDEVQRLVSMELSRSESELKGAGLYGPMRSFAAENIGCLKDTDYRLLHRDVAPNNLMLDKEGRLALTLDFETCFSGDRYLDLVFTMSQFRDERHRDMLKESYGVPSDFDMTSKIYRLVHILLFLRLKELKKNSKAAVLDYVENGGFLDLNACFKTKCKS